MARLGPCRSFKLYQIGVDMTSSGLLKKTLEGSPPHCNRPADRSDTVLRSQQSRLDPVPVVQPKEGEVPARHEFDARSHAQ